jgi:mono/diheme cytochrome c family protein
MSLLILIARAALLIAALTLWAACTDSSSDEKSTEAPREAPEGATDAGDTGAPGDDAEAGADADAGAGADAAAREGVEPIAPERIDLGREAYIAAQCAMCHGPAGKGGGLGPDLTDDSWDHGDGSVESIREVLLEGVTRGQMKSTAYAMAMPPIGRYIEDEDRVLALAQYVWSMSRD